MFLPHPKHGRSAFTMISTYIMSFFMKSTRFHPPKQFLPHGFSSFIISTSNSRSWASSTDISHMIKYTETTIKTKRKSLKKKKAVRSSCNKKTGFKHLLYPCFAVTYLRIVSDTISFGSMIIHRDLVGAEPVPKGLKKLRELNEKLKGFHTRKAWTYNNQRKREHRIKRKGMWHCKISTRMQSILSLHH